MADTLFTLSPFASLSSSFFPSLLEKKMSCCLDTFPLAVPNLYELKRNVCFFSFLLPNCFMLAKNPDVIKQLKLFGQGFPVCLHFFCVCSITFDLNNPRG